MATNDTTQAPPDPAPVQPTPGDPAPVVDPAPEKSSIEQRLDRIESGLASRLGLNLAEFDGQEILAARAAKIAEGIEKAKDVVEKTFTEAELTVEQRVQRIEKALTSGGTLA